VAPPIQISEQDWLQAKRILADQVPGLEVWAFGSRTNGHAKPYSDLDLALITAQALSLAQLADISHAFASSDMTIRVDLMDWANSSEAFRQIVSSSKVVVQSAPARS
jgi:predicted nucleotidyltransferase